MAFSYGRKFRRIAAQALSADPDEMRALRQRILPPRGDEDAPVLRLKSAADRSAAPVAILSAFFADEITGDEADDLLQRVASPEVRERYWRRPEDDPLADAIRAWGQTAWRSKSRPCCDAAGEGGELVNINENTSAAADGDAPR